MSFNAAKAKSFLNDCENFVTRRCKTSVQLSDISLYDNVKDSIKSICENAFEGSTIDVHLFGSRVVGNATEESDLDIFIDIDGRFSTTYTASREDDKRFHKLVKAVNESRDWRVVNHVLKTPVPVVKSDFLPDSLECDLILNNGLAICNCNLLAHLFSIQPQAISLFHFVKGWLKAQGFNHFKGYLVTLLVVFYLQSVGLMPSIERVQRNIPTSIPKKKIEGWEVQFDPKRTLANYNIPRLQSYKEHIKGFFRFYSKFDYSKVMSTHKGGVVEMFEYKNRHPRFWLKGIFIANPLNQGKNVGCVSYEHKNRFIELVKASEKVLQTAQFF